MAQDYLNIGKINAVKAFLGADKNGKRLLTDLFGAEVLNEKLSITDHVKSYEDACEITGNTALTLSDFIAFPPALRVATFAFHKITVIAEALNEGWAPNWDDSSQYKYYPWFDMRSSAAGGSGFSFYAYFCDYSRSGVGSRLVYRTAELARHAGTQFLDVYKDLMVKA